MNNAKAKSTREPLFHIVKRTDIPIWKGWMIRIIAVFAALVICGVIIVALTGENPIEMYKVMFEGSFKNANKFWSMLQELAILLCISLAVTPAFKMRFWNIGAEGQVLMGGLGALIAMKLLGDEGLRLPHTVVLPLTIIAALLAGALWGVIPAFFKAFWNTNETLFTLMMNYIAIQIVLYFQNIWSGGTARIDPVNTESFAGWLRFPPELDPSLGNRAVIDSSSGFLLNIIIVAVLTVLMFLYLRYSKQGYEISVVGESINTARYAGINVKKVIIRTMLISGLLCGVAGLLLVAGTNHTMDTTSVKGYGFTAIMVSWLAKFNPFYMILTAFLIIFLQKGSEALVTATGNVITSDIADVMIAIVIFFIIGCEFFINYQIKFRSTNRKEAAA